MCRRLCFCCKFVGGCVVSRLRPMSPHLGVYRLPFTAWLSIMHRMAGFVLYLGLCFYSWLLVLQYFKPGWVSTVLRLWPCALLVRGVLFGWFAALCYHYCNGIRHFIWDMGIGFSKKTATLSGCIVLGLALLMAAGLFFVWL
ncbi:succinate dehydrogenase, cytochrome b556 subunit [Anaplasma platys]|uniref:Succinate dehydrogenase cytochrome b556 subunit n=2 Tax=Anaplasma platys TaxID=949 RepID=A0A858PYW7_9RICK|nr:succinate dehydrogenase, cytochrome b556 subunit [Anaplasma platys]